MWRLQARNQLFIGGSPDPPPSFSFSLTSFIPSPSPLSFPFSLPFPSFRCPYPSNPARGSGERCKLPPVGLGRARPPNAFWCN